MDKQYDVKILLTKEDGSTYDYDATVEFSHEDNDYGNGYHMGIRSKDEPFGFGVYDIRYDVEFRKDQILEWLMGWYESRFNGKGGRWAIKRFSIEVNGNVKEGA